VASELLLAELGRARAYPKLREHVTAGDGAEFVSGDRHLVELADRFPIRTPRAFFEELGTQQE